MCYSVYPTATTKSCTNELFSQWTKLESTETIIKSSVHVHVWPMETLLM